MENNLAEQVIRKSLGPSGGWNKNALGAIEAMKKNRSLERRINIDPVTKLENEYPLQDMISGLQGRWKKDYKNGVSLKGTFIISDLDGLHDVNYRYGKRAGGNDYLRAVADSLVATAREENGRCFRNGKQADEFTLYLPGVVLGEQITSVLDQIDIRVREAEQKTQKNYPGIKFSLSYSVATFHGAYGPRQAFDDAENGMGEAKESGKNGERVGNIGRLFVNRVDAGNLLYG